MAKVTAVTTVFLRGALSAVRAQCNYLGVQPYWRPILCDTRGIIVAPSIDFHASSTLGMWHFWIFTHFHPFPPLFTLFLLLIFTMDSHTLVWPLELT